MANQGRVVLSALPMFRASFAERSSNSHRKRRARHFPTELPFAVRAMPRQTDTSAHQHDFAEIALIVDGAARHQYGRRHVHVRAGDWIAVRPGASHRYLDASPTFSLINLLFEPGPVLDMAGDLAAMTGFIELFGMNAGRSPPRLPRLEPVDLEYVKIQLEALSAELALRRPGFASAATSLFTLVAVRLARLVAGVESEAVQRSRVGQAIARVQQDYAAPLTLEDLVRTSHLSASSLARLFRAMVGRPPMRYLIYVRCLRAAELLVGTDWSMGEIATAVGFNDSNYFARQFHRQFRVSPTRYRRAQRAGGDAPPS